MKDSKQVRSEYLSFVEAYSQISKKDAEEAHEKKEKENVKKSSKKSEKDDECTCEKVLMRKNGAFTELAERYQMSVKQFARYVESNQGLFDIDTRKKATLANKFSGFKETVEWDEFFGDLVWEEMTTSHDFKKGSVKAPPAPQLPPPTSSPVKNPVGKKDKKHVPSLKGYRLKGNIFSPEETAVDGDDLQEVTTKETKSGTKYKVRVKDKATGSSYIRYATREKIAQLRADPKIASVEMTDEGDAPEDRGEKKAQAKGGGKKKLDPVGREDKDVDNDGDHDSSDKYLLKRRAAIGKAIKKRNVRSESFSNWRQDLSEVMDKVEKKSKGGKVNNKVVINPPMGENFDPQRVAESLGAELVSCEEVEQLDEFQLPGTGTVLAPRSTGAGTLMYQQKKVLGVPVGSPTVRQGGMPKPSDVSRYNQQKNRPTTITPDKSKVTGYTSTSTKPTPKPVSKPAAKPTPTTQQSKYGKVGELGNVRGNLQFIKDKAAEKQRILQQLRQSNELEGNLISERDDEPGEGVRQRYGDYRGIDRGPRPSKFGGEFQTKDKRPPVHPAAHLKLSKSKSKSKTQMAHFEPEGEVLDEKALSKKQQKFMGMVYAAKKGEKPASPEVAKAAASMTKKAARDFAKTKHKGLPEKKKEKK